MINVPGKLAIYYAWPSVVNRSANDITKATPAFSAYDIVVFGGGLESPTHGDHANTKVIIQKLKTPPYATKVYGYIPIGGENTNQLCPDSTTVYCSLTESQIRNSVDLWKAMGVEGIFLDEAGYDFGTSRQRQNMAVDYAHTNGLKVFINAWNPDEVFGPLAKGRVTYTSGHLKGQQSTLEMNPAIGTSGMGDASHLGPNDLYLHESFQIKNGVPQTASDWVSKSEKALAYRAQFGTRMATVTTTLAQPSNFEQKQFEYAWWSTLLYGFDYMGWGEVDFSVGVTAGTDNLPFHNRPNPGYLGNDYTSAVIPISTDLHRRTTPGGTIEVDSARHTAGISTAAFWRFEEGSGNQAKDSSSQGNHGRVSGARYSSLAQQYPNATNQFGLLFDSKGDFVTVPAGPSTRLNSFPNGITLEAFVKPVQLPIPPDASGKRIKYILWADDDVFALRLQSDAAGNTLLLGVINAVKGATGPCTLYANASFNRNLAGVFTHIALTYGSKSLKLYINGALVNQNTASATCNDVVGPVGVRNIVRIGSDETAEMQNFDRGFRGMIDEVRISNRALSPSEFLPRY